MRKNKCFIIGLIVGALLVGATGCAGIDLGILNFLNKSAEAGSTAAQPGSTAPSGSSVSGEEFLKQYEEEKASREAEEASKRAVEESRAEQQKRENQESYRQLKEQWDEASRRQQSRVDEIMGRNQGSSSASQGGTTGGNTASSVKVPVSGTWYGPVNQHTGDRSVVTLYSDGTAKVTIDMGAAELYTFNATYTSEKAGPYEYDDIVCRVTLSGNTSKHGFPSNTFTFIIDPEVEDGLYARFVDSGFGMTPKDSTFTKG